MPLLPSGTGALLLNTHSVIMCPHGGIVQHIPTTFTGFRVDGRRPMLMTDIYNIVGCSFFAGYISPCQMLTWLTGSTMLIIKGSPALTRNSVGACNGAAGMQGPAIITNTQTGEREPSEFTSIDW